ncbi:MAG: MCE family protein [Marinilabiliales bacterium]|nr:MAG: MCE family protein [Marinilabiliales bacterium]
MTTYKKLFIGITFIVAIGLFIWGYNFLKGKDIFNKQTIVFAEYEQVSGLSIANPVLINGFKVGQVSDMYFNPDMSGNIIVALTLQNKFPVPKNSLARIYSADLMGSKAIELRLGSSPEIIAPGDTLLTGIEASLMDEVNAQVQPIKMKAENLLASIDSLVVAFRTVFNENARDNLKESFNSIKNTFYNLESTTSNLDSLVITERSNISSILQNVDSLTYTLSNNREEIATIITNFKTLSDSLAKTDIPGTLGKADVAIAQLNSILTKINEGQGTVGMLVHNDSLYIELDRSAAELNLLLKDIRENPKRYVKFSLF